MFIQSSVVDFERRMVLFGILLLLELIVIYFYYGMKNIFFPIENFEKFDGLMLSTSDIFKLF